jgi:HSP20 family protein
VAVSIPDPDTDDLNKEGTMAFRDLIPWSKTQQLAPSRDGFAPFLTLHREMNRLFDDMFRGFGDTGFGPLAEGRAGWPRVELNDTGTALTVSAELPGLTEKDVQVEIGNGVLTIRGETEAERTEGRYFSERFHGAFERQIPLDGVQEDKAEASFRNGVLTISLPKSDEPRAGVKRIAINAR